ncbi:hypothetical protein GCM10011390_31850 [Aureimonas endophytica]|uniref:Uncharacterized protein n=1 Tax=Aureimonas endophytica TaxID=2027858 RepID=A0A916ZS98_9HYPH|nr:hypothetical protein [Aureimonas endophytica]GGE10461.1 hypothetical protein GCM10011390_31850 [Aureimonas endophytica]
MLTDDEKDRISLEIGKLLEGQDIEDVASILAGHIAMVAAHGGETKEEAVDFLDDIRDEAEEMLETIDFDALHAGDDEDEDEEDEEDEADAKK